MSHRRREPVLWLTPESSANLEIGSPIDGVLSSGAPGRGYKDLYTPLSTQSVVAGLSDVRRASGFVGRVRPVRRRRIPSQVATVASTSEEMAQTISSANVCRSLTPEELQTSSRSKGCSHSMALSL